MKELSFVTILILLEELGLNFDTNNTLEQWDYQDLWEFYINKDKRAYLTDTDNYFKYTEDKTGLEISEKGKESGLTEERVVEILNTLGELVFVEIVGGGEGDGEHYHEIFKFDNADVYFRREGYYDSWEGITVEPDVAEVHKSIVVREEYYSTKDNYIQTDINEELLKILEQFVDNVKDELNATDRVKKD